VDAGQIAERNDEVSVGSDECKGVERGGGVEADRLALGERAPLGLGFESALHLVTVRAEVGGGAESRWRA
jgi:hypothetical protein